MAARVVGHLPARLVARLTAGLVARLVASPIGLARKARLGMRVGEPPVTVRRGQARPVSGDRTSRVDVQQRCQLLRFDRVHAEHHPWPATRLLRRVTHVARHWLRERASEPMSCAPAFPCPLQPRSGTLRARDKLRVAHADPPPERCDAPRHSGKPASPHDSRRAGQLTPSRHVARPSRRVRCRADSRYPSPQRPVPTRPRHHLRRVRGPVWRTT